MSIRKGRVAPPLRWTGAAASVPIICDLPASLATKEFSMNSRVLLLVFAVAAIGWVSRSTETSAADADGKLRIIVFGAHPDDAEFKAGGTAAKWVKLGHHVKLCSVINGDTGHWQMAGGPLAQRRTAE